jgi:predicted helicase
VSFKQYLAGLQENLKSGHATEATHYSALEKLVEELEPQADAIALPKHITDVGNPDFRVQRKGKAVDFPVGWIEAKDVGTDLDRAEESDQLDRYKALPNLVLTDFLEFRWYTDGEHRLTARLGHIGKGDKLVREPEGEERVQQLLIEFLRHEIPAVVTPKDLAIRMAGLAHLIRDIIVNSFQIESEAGELHKQLEAFRQTLIPDIEPDQFADMYAQTIAYGLFAARCQPANGKFTREHAGYLIPRTNPFLRKLFNEIAGPDLDKRIAPFVDDLVALLRDADMASVLADFGKRTAKEDPVVHFYEDFLQAYDPKVREMRGVYYTPEPVVSYIVRSIDHLLKTRFNKPMGLADKDVLVLDPACGTGTFLYYVIRHIYQALLEQGQKGQWDSYVSQNLLKRVFGFELLMAPYAVTHLKLGLLLKELGYQFDADERLGIYLTNTLEEALKKSELLIGQWIADEANAASEIKRDKPIMVVLGNPPYSGISANRGKWITHLIEDYKRIDGKPLGERKHWLQDDYVKFFRFAQWRIERTGGGILGFVTNHGYLDNPTFRGMRYNLAKTFTDIHVLDLHGNAKKQERCPDGSEDNNVFDIQQGVAIGIFVKAASQGLPAKMERADLWGLRRMKYEVLSSSSIESTSWRSLPFAPPFYLFAIQGTELLPDWEQAWVVTDIFRKYASGIASARDSFVVDIDLTALKARIEVFRGNEDDQNIRDIFKLHDTRGWKLPAARVALRKD